MDPANRTLYEAMLDVDYAVCLWELHARLFERVHKGIAFVGMVGATASVYTLVTQDPMAAGIYGIVIAVLSIFDLVYDPGKLAAAHRQTKQAFLGLRSRLHELTVQEVDAEIARIAQGAPAYLDSLRYPAHRRNLRRHGHPTAHLRLGRVERLFDHVA